MALEDETEVATELEDTTTLEDEELTDELTTLDDVFALDEDELTATLLELKLLALEPTIP